MSQESLMDLALKYRKGIAAVILVLVAVAGVSSARRSAREARESKAAEALFAAQSATGDSQIQALEKVSLEHPGTAAAGEALILIGEAHSKKDPSGSASIPWFQKADLQARQNRDRLFARYALAFAQERGGKLAEAAATLESAQKLGEPLLKAELALAKARILQRSGKTAEANQAYDAIAREFSGSEASRTAEQWKALK